MQASAGHHPKRRRRWIVLSLVALLALFAVIGAANSDSSNGWTAPMKEQLLDDCQGTPGGCECAVEWLSKHLSPQELVEAAQNGTYVETGIEMVAACPQAKGSGILGM